MLGYHAVGIERAMGRRAEVGSNDLPGANQLHGISDPHDGILPSEENVSSGRDGGRRNVCDDAGLCRAFVAFSRASAAGVETEGAVSAYTELTVFFDSRLTAPVSRRAAWH